MTPLLAHLICLLLSLRYRVRLHGAELLDQKGPVLLLPNHQALVDPQILLAHAYRHRRVSPVITETYFQIPILNLFFRYLGAIPVPFQKTAEKNLDFRAVFANVTQGLQSGKSIVLYPSGQLCGQGKEAIFGKQSAYIVAQDLPPTVRVIGVRTSGLWGSMWSRAWIGRTPPFFWTMAKSAFFILANGIFFCPRRTVSIEFHDITERVREQCTHDLTTFNTALEEFYNEKGEEEVLFRKHVFYAPALRRTLPDRIQGSIAEQQNVQGVSEAAVDPEVLAFVQQKIAALRECPVDAVTLEANLILDLNFDSLALAEIVMIIKAAYPAASNPPLSSLKTVGNLCVMAQGQSTEEEELPPCTFARDHAFPDDPCRIDIEKSIVDHVRDVCRADPSAPFCYDALFGSLTRRQFLRRATVVSHVLTKVSDEKYIGLMLPALQSTSMLILSTHLAGKVPVMFNWTVGEICAAEGFWQCSTVWTA